MDKEKDSDIKIGVDVDMEKIQDTVDILKEINDTKPNITIRNNENVYVTINNFNETEQEYLKSNEK